MAKPDGSSTDVASGASPANNGNAGETKRKRGRPAIPPKQADSGGNGTSGTQGGETAHSAEPSGTPSPAPEPTGTSGAADPESFAPQEAPKKKRGRPPGSGAGRSRPQASATEDINLEDAVNEIQGAYHTLALVTGVPAFMISKDKAEALAKAFAGVQKHFGLKVDGPTASIVKLVLVGGWVNAPILMQLAAINAAKQAQRRAQPAAQPSTVEEASLAETGLNGERPRYRFQS